MKKLPVFRLLLAALIYLGLFVLASSCGLIHPACYAYAGTFVPILFSLLYLYTASTIQGLGAALLLNGFVLIVGLIMGEGNPPMIIGLILLALAAELIRKLCGYETLRGVLLSFIPLAFSFYAYSRHEACDRQYPDADRYAAFDDPRGDPRHEACREDDEKTSCGFAVRKKAPHERKEAKRAVGTAGIRRQL